MKIKILLAEDDTSLGFVIADQLRAEDYNVTLCTDGLEAFKQFNEESFHMCIFDVMMPKQDGFSLVKDIRKINSKIPILFLTAKTDDEDKLIGFKSGGDDYLTKPFNMEELKLRVAALLRRVNIEKEEKEPDTYEIGEYKYDVVNYNLSHPKFEKNLTKKEAQILKLLCKDKNKTVPKETILKIVWGQDDYFVGRSLDVFITKIRKYLKEDNNISLTNIHGIGFKLEVEE